MAKMINEQLVLNGDIATFLSLKMKDAQKRIYELRDVQNPERQSSTTVEVIQGKDLSEEQKQKVKNLEQKVKNPEELQKWEEKMMEENKERAFIKYIYWKAEFVSCVLVERNRTWFQDNIEDLRKVWNIIEKERVTGYGHRAPNKREKKQPTESKSKGCLIKLNKDSGKVSISAEEKINFGKLEIIKIYNTIPLETNITINTE
jgi:hypothetical protein